MKELARINPKGERQHDHTMRAKIHATRDVLERLLGPPHSEGDGAKVTAEWFLVTDHGSATVYNYWAFEDEVYGVDAANDATSLLVVTFLKANNLDAYCLWGEL